MTTDAQQPVQLSSPWDSFAPWAWLVAVLLVTLLAYSNTLDGTFLYDDSTFIINNPTVHSLTNPAKFFFDRAAYSADGRMAIYRPLPALSFALNYSLSPKDRSGRPQPFGFHLVNVLTHAACAALLFILLLNLFRRPLAAGLASLLFALHPVNTEAVAWISSRSNTFFLFFLLAAFLFHVLLRRQPGRSVLFYPLVLLSYVLSLLSKEHAIVLPLLLLLYDFLILPGTPSSPRTSPADLPPLRRPSWPELIRYYLPLLLLAAGYLVLRHLVLGQTEQTGYYGSGFLATMFTMIRVFVTYLRQLFLPLGLSIHYGVPIRESFFDWQVILCALLLLCLLVLAILLRRRLALCSFVVAWFFISLAPVSNVVPLQALQDDRFLYLTTVGLTFPVAAVLAWCLERRRCSWALRILAPLTVVFASLLCVVAFILTVRQNRAWLDPLSLWTAAVRNSPTSDRAHTNLGMALAALGRTPEAMDHWRIAYQLNPRTKAASLNLAQALFTENTEDLRQRAANLEEAESMARAAALTNPEHWEPLSLLGSALLELGRRDEATRSFQDAIRLADDLSELALPARLALARIYLTRGTDPDELQHALTLTHTAWQSRDPEAGLLLVRSLRLNHRTDEAVSLARELLRTLPSAHTLVPDLQRELRLMHAPELP